MSPYAKKTKVPVGRSKTELESILTNYGADQFVSGWDKDKVMIQFRMHDRYIRVQMPMPDEGSEQKTAQEHRRRWRALILYVKAKLESVESDIVSFEQAFMAHIVMPDGMTVGDHLVPKIELAYKKGNLPPLLPHF